MAFYLKKTYFIYWFKIVVHHYKKLELETLCTLFLIKIDVFNFILEAFGAD